MISLFLLLVLAWGFYIGYRRGLLLQVYYLVSAMISAFIAGQFYKSLGDQFHLLVPYTNPQEGQGTFLQINFSSWIRYFMQVSAIYLYLLLFIVSVVCLDSFCI